MKSSDFYSAVVTMLEPLVGVASREIQYMSSGTYNTVSKFQSFLISLSQTFNRHSLTLEHLTSFILSILAKSSRTSQYCILCRSSACAHVRGSWSPESWTIRICDDSLSRKYFWHGSLASSFISIASIKYIFCSDGLISFNLVELFPTFSPFTKDNVWDSWFCVLPTIDVKKRWPQEWKTLKKRVFMKK